MVSTEFSSQWNECGFIKNRNQKPSFSEKLGFSLEGEKGNRPKLLSGSISTPQATFVPSVIKKIGNRVFTPIPHCFCLKGAFMLFIF